MNDLLAQESFSRDRGDDKKKPVDLEKGYGHETDKHLAHFFDEVAKIKNDMERIKSLLGKLQDAHEESKAVHKAKAMKALRDRMDKDVEEVLTKAKHVKEDLEKLDRSNIANRKVPGCEEGSPTDRTRMVITANLRKNLKDLMGEFQKLRQKMMGEYRETIERRYFTVTGQHPDQETIEYIIETGESEDFLQRAIQDQGRGHILETIREIQERHGAIRQMEKNLLELHQIFLDIAVLVESQGEQLNNIEVQVSKAAAYVENGAVNLRVARKHQRSSRKCMCIGIIILLVVIFIVAAPILLKMKKKSNN